MNCSTPGLPVHHQLPESTQTHVHRVDDESEVEVLIAQLYLTLYHPMAVTHQAPLPWNFLGKNTGVGSHSLLQGIFPDPEIKPSSPALQADSLPSEQPGNLSLSFGMSQLFA